MTVNRSDDFNRGQNKVRKRAAIDFAAKATDLFRTRNSETIRGGQLPECRGPTVQNSMSSLPVGESSHPTVNAPEGISEIGRQPMEIEMKSGNGKTGFD